MNELEMILSELEEANRCFDYYTMQTCINEIISMIGLEEASALLENYDISML